MAVYCGSNMILLSGYIRQSWYLEPSGMNAGVRAKELQMFPYWVAALCTVLCIKKNGRGAGYIFFLFVY